MTRKNILSEEWIDKNFIFFQEEFYKHFSSQLPNSIDITTTGLTKETTSFMILQSIEKFVGFKL